MGRLPKFGQTAVEGTYGLTRAFVDFRQVYAEFHDVQCIKVDCNTLLHTYSITLNVDIALHNENPSCRR